MHRKILFTLLGIVLLVGLISGIQVMAGTTPPHTWIEMEQIPGEPGKFILKPFILNAEDVDLIGVEFPYDDLYVFESKTLSDGVLNATKIPGGWSIELGTLTDGQIAEICCYHFSGEIGTRYNLTWGQGWSWMMYDGNPVLDWTAEGTSITIGWWVGLPIVAKPSPEIILHNGLPPNDEYPGYGFVYVGWPVNFTVSTGESGTWTGTQPEAGTFVGTDYVTSFRSVRNNPETVAVTLNDGTVLTKKIVVIIKDGDGFVGVETSCVTDCTIYETVTATTSTHGTWSMTESTLWTWNLAYPPFGFIEPEVQTAENIYSFMMKFPAGYLSVLGQDPSWGGYNVCTHEEYFVDGYFCDNGTWTSFWVTSTSGLPEGAQQVEETWAQFGYQPPEGWWRHMTPVQ